MHTRWLAFLLGLLLSPVSALLLVAAVALRPSLSGWGYVLGLALASVGLLTRPWRQRRGLTRAGVGLLLLVVGTRLLLVDGGSSLRTPRLPDGGSRLINRMVDEREGVLLAAHALLLSGGLNRTEAREFIPALEAAYARLARAEGQVATPAVATYLGLQSPRAFDAVVIAPKAQAPETAVVLLHGYAGNFAVYCWQLARAAEAISALTVCPSVGPRGDWWSPQGEETLKHTLAWLAGRGVRRVYLAGLSNGGVGVGVLSERVSHPGIELGGLVYLSGIWPKASAPRVPVLIVQGRHDSMMTARTVRAFARQVGPRATYLEVDSGHFAFLDRREECERAIASWLREREGRGTGAAGGR
jgi:pimeloyl-ACP methyl ester carboxylesterase